MGLGDVFSNAWKEYSSNFVSLLSFMALFYFLPLIVMGVLIFIILIFSGLGPLIASSFISGQEVAFENMSAGFLPIFVACMLIFVLFSAALAIFYNSAFYGLNVKNRNYDWRSLASVAKSSFWKFLGRVILLGLIMLGLLLLLIVPAIIFGIYWIFAIFIWFNEPNKGFGYSLSKSKELVKGRWWKTFGYVVLITLIYFVASIILSYIPLLGSIANVFAAIFLIYFFRHMYIDYSSKRK